MFIKIEPGNSTVWLNPAHVVSLSIPSSDPDALLIKTVLDDKFVVNGRDEMARVLAFFSR
ncbi:MAG: hypothetical protein ABI411_06790 [Tahibacter sp.]